MRKGRSIWKSENELGGQRGEEEKRELGRVEKWRRAAALKEGERGGGAHFKSPL